MLAAKAQENTFFPYCPLEEAKWLSSQRTPQRVEPSPGSPLSVLGGRGVAADWAMQLSIP